MLREGEGGRVRGRQSERRGLIYRKMEEGEREAERMGGSEHLREV